MWFSATLHLFLAFQSNFYEEGLKAMQERRYQAAAEDFNNAIAAEPKDYSIHFNLALAYSLLSKDAEAAAEYRKCLELKPGLYEADLNLAILLLRQKLPDEAAIPAAEAAAAKPKEFKPNYYLGEALSESGELVKAEAAYRAALEADPGSAAAEAGLGRTLAQQDRLIEAEPHYRKAAELDARYRDSLLGLGQMFEDRDQPEPAIAIYKLFPENGAARERIGALEIKQGKAAEAVANMEAAVAQSPTAANRAALATAYLRNAQRDKAYPVVRQLLREHPDDFELQMLYARMLRDGRKLADAAQEFERAAQLKPDAVEAWSELAGLLVVAGNYPAALAALDRVAALHSEKPGHVFLRAIVFDKTRQLKPALESYRRFLALSQGANPNQEFQARQRARIIQQELNKR